MVKPCLKDVSRSALGTQLVLEREPGVVTTVDDPDRHVLMLLDLADGTRTTQELAEAMAARWPHLTEADVAEGIEALDAAGLLENAAAAPALSPRQQQRYHTNLAFFSTFASLGRDRYAFQQALRDAHVVLLGLGGLGSMLLLSLAGLGVGRVTAVECDTVKLKNLSRQSLFNEGEVGLPQVIPAVSRARALNAETRITAVRSRIETPGDVAVLLGDATLVLSLIDEPRGVQEWVNRACVETGVPFIAGGTLTTRGVYYSVDPGRSGCLGCQPAASSPPPRINQAIGPAAGVMAGLIGLEAVRYLTGFASPVSAGRQWVVDFVTGESGVDFSWERMDNCPVCGRTDQDPTPAGRHESQRRRRARRGPARPPSTSPNA